MRVHFTEMLLELTYNVLQLNADFVFHKICDLVAVSSSTVNYHKCPIGERNLFLFFFVRWENKKIDKI